MNIKYKNATIYFIIRKIPSTPKTPDWNTSSRTQGKIREPIDCFVSAWWWNHLA